MHSAEAKYLKRQAAALSKPDVARERGHLQLISGEDGGRRESHLLGVVLFGCWR